MKICNVKVVLLYFEKEIYTIIIYTLHYHAQNHSILIDVSAIYGAGAKQ